jgi:flagellum-specific peptidoglycan hydrolase FlgJ
MTAKEFVSEFKDDAKITFQKTGILPEATLAQSALETGWGKHCPGFMMFGVKDFDGINGNEQLITTFEYSSRFGLTPKQIGLENISGVKPVMLNGKRFFKYTGQAYFRKYNSAEESFTDHARVLMNTKLKDGTLRYAKALAVASDAPKFFIELEAAGYAQADNYSEVLTQMAKQIKSLL